MSKRAATEPAAAEAQRARAAAAADADADLAHDFSALLPPNWRRAVTAWLDEDIPSFDVGGAVVGDGEAEAKLYCKASGVLCGRPFVDAVFAALDCRVAWAAAEGAAISVDDAPRRRVVVATVHGPVRKLLLGERTALNVMARASGIASAARRLHAAKRAAGWAGRVAATRKTTPGFRLVEKYAVLVGGCDPHRMDLSSMTMLKDNHVHACGGSIAAAVRAARRLGGFALKVEVECQSEAEAEEAIGAGADVVMLDNFSADDIVAPATALKARHPHVVIEASGGITADTAPAYMRCSAIDVISMGALTQGYSFVDFSLKVEQEAGAAGAQ